MSRKSAGKAVEIVGVSAFDERKAGKTHRREWTVLGHSIAQGAAYAHGLAYPPPGILPAGEAAVTALTMGGDGALYGVTSGARAHFFWMPRPLLIADLGVVSGVASAAEGLALDADGILYGASRDKGGPLFSYDTSTGYLGPYRSSSGPITLRSAPFKGEGAASIALSHDRRTLAGIGDRTGRPFLYSLKNRRTRVLKAPSRSGAVFGRVLCAGADNCFYGSGGDGRLFRLSPEGDVASLDAALPCRRGKAYLARVTAFIRARSGRLCGGTEDGYLFTFDPVSGRIVSHGRPNDIPDLHALAETADGSLYGLTGRGAYAAHLVRFRPQTAEWLDMGLFQAHGHYPWIGYQVRALTAGPGGQLFAGEHDATGHVFIYHPAPEDEPVR